MANPSYYYAWTFPQEYQDAWEVQLQSGFSQMDATVWSVSQLFSQIGKATLVVSVNPVTPSNYPNEYAFPATNVFASASVAPYGALTGTINVAYSGAIVRFDLLVHDQITATQAVKAYENSLTHTQWRIVTAGSSLNLSTDSHWRSVHHGFGRTQALWFTTLSSLGMGVHTVTIETRGYTWTSLIQLKTETHNLTPLAPLTLWATMESL